jgi:hypothetical protein
VSSLPAGTYQVTELYSGQAAGTVTLNNQGSFSNWSVTLPALAARETWMLRLTLAQPTATAAAKGAFAPQLYPNPAATQVRLEIPGAATAKVRLTVYDLQGRVVQKVSTTGNAHTLDTSLWTNGTYFVKVEAAAGVSTQRLVVLH